MPDILKTDYELGDEYDDVPRFSEMSNEEQAANSTIAEDFALAAGLQVGEVPPVGTVIEKSCKGEDKASSLGKAYITRDQIQEAGGECEVEYIGPEILINGALYHTVEITITETASAEE